MDEKIQHTTSLMMNSDLLLTKAKSQLTTKYPYFGMLASRLKHEEKPIPDDRRSCRVSRDGAGRQADCGFPFHPSGESRSEATAHAERFRSPD